MTLLSVCLKLPSCALGRFNEDAKSYVLLIITTRRPCEMQILSLVDDTTTGEDLPTKVHAYLATVMPPQANKHATTLAIFSKISIGIEPPPGTDLLDAKFVAQSNLPDSKLQEFLEADIGTGRAGRLREGLIYGIGKVSIANLAKENIATVHQLLGRLLCDNSGKAGDVERANTWM